jgi:nucleoside phosphorylase
MSQVDVLIVTALKEEYEAAREVGLRGYADNQGITTWDDHDQETPPYIMGNYMVTGGAQMSVALARPTRMGSNATGPVVSSLVERLKPQCLAMCGVCAGNPADVALGDVIVAELAYAYDEGKRTKQAFEADHRQIPMLDPWLRSAQDLSPVDLPSYGEATENEAKRWLLERLDAAEDPRINPARPRYFPGNTWSEYLLSWEGDGFIARSDTGLSLTEKGRAHVKRTLFDDVNGPERLPFKIVVGPMASGNVVVKDGLTWEQLKQLGVRTVVGLEMEAATIANTAYRLSVDNWLVAKGVMDYADPRKNDRYKRFAARASAEVLFKLLAQRLATDKAVHTQGQTASLARHVYVIGGVTGATSYPSLERVELEQVCTDLGSAIAQAGAELVVCSPYPDAADVYTVSGYVKSGAGGAVHFHSPDHPAVAEKHSQLLKMLGNDIATRIVYWRHPGPEDESAWEQAWLLCQLQALDQADAVMSIGGRFSNSANTLLHLAELQHKPVLPFAFLGGASQRAFERRDWARLYPGFDYSILEQKASIANAIDAVNHLMVTRTRGSHRYKWPPRTVFISRARPDAEFGEALQNHLNSNGYRALLGDAQVSSGRMVESAIEEALLSADLFVVIWSASYALSRFCYDELDLALQRHEAGDLQIWIFNVDGSDVVPRGARRFSPIVTRTPQLLVTVAQELLQNSPSSRG